MQVTENMEKYTGNLYTQSSEALVGYDHAFARINLGLSDRFANPLPVQFENFIFSRLKFSSDWISSPICRTPTETGETDIADRHHVRMNEMTVTPKAGLVAQFMIPIPIHVKHWTFECRDNPKEIGGAFVADIAGNNDRVEGIFLNRPQFSDSHQIVVDVRKSEQSHFQLPYDERLR
jgi:hypothetical protein